MKKTHLILSVALISLVLVMSASAEAFAQSEATNTTRTPIQHVIMIMLENHSFDNIYGVFPTDNGTINNPIVDNMTVPINLLQLHPAPTEDGVTIHAVPAGTYWTADPNEGYSEYHTDWNHGQMNGFVSASGSQSMTYFDQNQLAIEWDWAEEYGIGDKYFSTLLTETDPNRVASLAGFAPISSDEGPPPYIPVNESIFGELSHYGVSWGYYVLSPSPSIFPLDYFGGIGQYSSHIKSWPQFFNELKGGGFPSVSWIMATGGGTSNVYDQHPSSNMTVGELWVNNIINGVMNSKYWNSSVIFITYDEWGGYYDQVPPPVVDGVQLGGRVPLIVVSPYAKEDYVSNTILNHDSQIAFVDYNWGLPALNQFVADTNLPLDFFDFNQPYSGGNLVRSPLPLSNSTGYPIQPQMPFVELPYSRSGSSSVTLASLGAPIYTLRDTSYTPFYQSTYAVIIVAVALLAALLAVSILRKKRMAHGTSGRERP
ncbi:MAG: alkaline phosphatase family protein [Nitrososphaerota archaeon]|nr:alkaline phosphatase family protein [Nitrososphaerota archaeon]MDG7038139.1 alkaline phosphatase family protein [Nitrososphaerota archaeon]MDG7039876.1 alkaline phosphatase family protein [Nitrososphaerota archaeon]MDG7046407.1 alkaline phosphatase family protein [Nitrososphaerota archaeon]